MGEKITDYELSLIWLEVEPEATSAFERLAADHGRRFATIAREFVMADKLLAFNAAVLKGDGE